MYSIMTTEALYDMLSSVSRIRRFTLNKENKTDMDYHITQIKREIAARKIMVGRCVR